MVAVSQRDALPKSHSTSVGGTSRSSAPPAHWLTAIQVRAIRTAMQIFVEEDLAFGRGRDVERWCTCCNAERPSAGSIAYECGSFCNTCATEYELSRVAGVVRSPQEFLTR